MSTIASGTNPAAEPGEQLQSMFLEVAEGPEVYRPSRFWADMNKINQEMIEELGLENLKRTLAQNYFNWLVTSRMDPQYAAIRRLWISRPTLRPYLNRLEEPDLLRTVQPYLARMESPSMPAESMGAAPSIGHREWRTYKLFVGMLWEYALRKDWSGISQSVVEPETGNPIRIIRRDKLITQDLANSIREYNAILEGDRSLASRSKRVAELGAGYGRLAHVFLSEGRTQYFIFDIPPALFVSEWYLNATHGEKRIFRFRHFERFADVSAELEKADVAFFTPNQMELFPASYFDVFASISTLPEMAANQIDNYLRQAERLAAGFVYLKQWHDWENPADGYRVTADRMLLSDDWLAVYDRDDAVQPHFFERLWRRRQAWNG